MNSIRKFLPRRVTLLILVLALSTGIMISTTGCTLWCSVFTCATSTTPSDPATVTYKSLKATNIAAQTAMKILKHELVPAGKVSPEMEAKIVKVYEDYGIAFNAACDGLILADNARTDAAFTSLKSLFNNLLSLLQSVGVLTSPQLTAEPRSLLVPYAAPAILVKGN